MIFASVGSMLPFDRLVKAVDDWAAENRDVPVFLQIGNGSYRPVHAQSARMLPHQDYADRLKECRLFVAHAGIGSLVQALEIGRQTLMLPRLARLGEHTTDHQLHTAARFRGTPGLQIAEDIADLKEQISSLLGSPLHNAACLPPHAPADMLARVRGFIQAAR